MARIGMRYPRCCPVTVTQNLDGTESEALGQGIIMGKAIGANLTVNAESQVQYADDGPAETVAEFTGGTLALELNDMIDTVAETVIGHTIDGDGDLVSNTDDAAPFLRVAWVVPKILDNKRLYQAICLMRTKFAPSSPQYASKAQNITFGSETITAQLMRDANRDWRRERTFDTLTAALNWANEKTNMPTGPAPALTASFTPVNAATAVARGIAVRVELTNPINHGSAVLLNASTGAPVQVAVAFSSDKKTLILTPSAQLTASTQYRVVTSNIVDAYAQQLPDTAITFTTGA